MKIIRPLPLLAVCLAFAVPTFAFASFIVSGRVTNQSNNPIAGTTVSAAGPTAASTLTDGTGAYALTLEVGTYDFHVTPPSGSGFGEATVPARVITADTPLDFVLIPAGFVTFAGTVLDAVGQPAANQRVALTTPGAWPDQVAETDAAGRFSLTVSPGNYSLFLQQYTAASATTPQSYHLWTQSFAVTGSSDQTITLPFKRISVRVQDTAGNGLPGVRLSAPLAYTNNFTVAGLPADLGFSGYYNYNTELNPATDSNGDASLWLLPSLASQPYNITATPPPTFGFGPTTSTDVAVNEDRSLTIILQPSVTFAGTVLDALGQPAANQRVALTTPGTWPDHVAETDAAGRFSLTVSPGNYSLFLQQDTAASATTPQSYRLWTQSFAVTGSSDQTITLPFKRISVRVQDTAGNGLPGVRLSVPTAYTNNFTVAGLPADLGFCTYYNYNTDVNPATDSNGNASLWLLPSIASQPYTITATPPPAFSFGPTTITDVAVSEDRSLTITLQPSVTFAGTVLDALGQPAANQRVALTTPGAWPDLVAETDAAGRFSLTVSPGNYSLFLQQDTAASATTPQSYRLWTQSFAVTGSSDQTITLPFKRVSVRVQDTAGNGLPGVRLSVPTAYTNNFTVAGLPADHGFCTYYNYNTDVNPATDSNGNASLWLLPSIASQPYTITATPPPNSPFATFNLTDVSVSGDRSIVVVLQFVHAPPVSTASFSPAAESDGTYGGPVTVTLNATATQGFLVSSIYYSLDDGLQQIYTGSIAVTGDGSHTLKFWAVDNVGVYEAPHTVSFVIASDQIAPTTTLTASPAPNSAGWNNMDVQIALSATDNSGGSGVAGIGLEITGAQAAQLTAAGPTLNSLISAEGVSTLRYFALDNRNNTEAEKSSVIRLDKTAPVISTPADIVAKATSAAGATVAFSATASDALSGIASVTTSKTSGSTFAFGTTTVTINATDAAGNVATSSFTVTVADTTAPVITSLSASPTRLRPPDHRMVAVRITALVTDAVDPAPTTKIVSVTSNEAVRTNNNDDLAPDWRITGPLTLNLRAERAGKGNGRVYRITVEARDAAGNVSTRAVTVSVPKSQGNDRDDDDDDDKKGGHRDDKEDSKDHDQKDRHK